MKIFLVSLMVGLGTAVLLSLMAEAADKPVVRTLAKGAFSGINEAKQEVFKEQKSWERFWAMHSIKEQYAAQIPRIDFSNEMVIAVTMGRKNSGGYAIEITEVEPATKTLKILVKRTNPRPGSLVITALTAPFHFVAVPKSDLKPEFIEVPAIDRK